MPTPLTRFPTKPILLALLAVAAAIPAPLARAAEPYKPAAHPAEVKTLETTWHYNPADFPDDKNRELPVKIYYPADIAARKTPCPLIIFSHGLGGSREGYAMWGEAWAAAGYIVVHPQHIGSDTRALLGGMDSLHAAMGQKNALLRTDDVRFVIDQMQKAQTGDIGNPDLAPLKNKIDLAHIGMAGHSFGAATTLAIAGETFPGKDPSRADKRITAAIAMSPQPALAIDQKTAFGSIHIPMLYFTGTKDDTELGIPGRPNSPGNTTAADRKVPFENAVDPRTYLAVFVDATHMSFAQPERPASPTGTTAPAPAAPATPGPDDPKPGSLRALLAARRNGNTGPHIQHFVADASIAFWDAYLKSDPAAKAWLETDFPKELGSAGTFQKHK